MPKWRALLASILLATVLVGPHWASAQDAADIPDEAVAHLANAQDYQASGQLGLALVEVDEALAIAPDYADAQQLQAQLSIQATATVQQALDAQAAAAAAQAAPPPPAATTAGGCPVAVEIPNPWCYNFVQGSTISSPPAAFCQYFRCIANFGNGRGYVVQCRDGTFSKSGGISGSCSSHGGNGRALRAP
jgi:hypothetical protein